MLFVWERFVSRLQCPQGERSHGDEAGPREGLALCPGPEGWPGAVGLLLPSARPRSWPGPHHGPVPSLPLPCSPFPAEPAPTRVHPGEGRQDEASLRAGWSPFHCSTGTDSPAPYRTLLSLENPDPAPPAWLQHWQCCGSGTDPCSAASDVFWKLQCPLLAVPARRTQPAANTPMLTQPQIIPVQLFCFSGINL